MEHATLEKPLPEGAVAVLLDAQRLVNITSNRITNARDALERCKVPVNGAKLRKVLDDLEAVYADMCDLTLAHLDAIDASAKEPA